MKMKTLILILTSFFSISLAQERIIIENNGNTYNLKIENFPEYFKKHKHSKKYNKQKKIYKKHYRNKSKYYIASKNGKVFHKPDCRFAKRIKKKIKFITRKEAIVQGLRPCKLCKP